MSRPTPSPSYGRRKRRNRKGAPRNSPVQTSVEQAGLTPREWLAIGHYFAPEVNYNKAEACRRAGYAFPSSQANRVFGRPPVVAEINRRRAELAVKFDIGPADVLRELTKLAFFNLGDYGEIDATTGEFLIDLSEVTRDQMAALGSYEIETYTKGSGEEAREVKRVRIKPPDKLGALDKLARHLGLFNDKMNVNVNGDLAAAILAAKNRVKAPGDEE